ADDVDDRLELAGVPHELAGERGLLDRRVRRDRRSHRFEIVLPLQRLGELALHVVATRSTRRQACELAPSVTFDRAPHRERALELAAFRVRDDRPRRIRLDAPAVEVIDAPALVAVLEAVLLA